MDNIMEKEFAKTFKLINDNFTNTQGINTDKVNNLMEALQTLNLLVG